MTGTISIVVSANTKNITIALDKISSNYIFTSTANSDEYTNTRADRYPGTNGNKYTNTNATTCA